MFIPQVVFASNYYVSTTGSDTNPGSQTKPWKTIQYAANKMVTGDTALIQAGTYNEEPNITTSGITLQAQGKVNTNAFTIYGNNNTIRGFTITDPNSDWGILTRGGSYNLIEGNDISHTKQDGIWFFGSHNIFRGNYIHDTVDPSIDTHVDCFQTWGWDYGATDILFDKNICITPVTAASKNQQIVMLSRSTAQEVRDITFTNNIFVIYQPTYAALNFDVSGDQGRASNITVENNTIINMDRPSPPREVEGIYFGNIDNVTAVNNLLVNFGNTSFWPNHPYGTSLIDVNGCTGVNIHNNAVYNTDGIPPAETPYPGDIWMQDPKVVNLAGLDFHLLSTSPLIDKGANLSGEVTNDYDGTSRPQGAGYDIGAYEYVSGATPTSAPTPTIQPTASPAPTATPTLAPKLGDANGDGQVNETDFTIWLGHFGQAISGIANGDFNGDGHVDGIDYTIWLNNCGK